MKKRAEDEMRKEGTLPPKLDEEGNAINPHIPEFMAAAPWYVDQKSGLQHQRLGETLNPRDRNVAPTPHQSESRQSRPRGLGTQPRPCYGSNGRNHSRSSRAPSANPRLAPSIASACAAASSRGVRSS